VLGEQPLSPARCAVRKRRRQTAKSVAIAWPRCGGRDDIADGLFDSGGDVREGLGGQMKVVAGVCQRGMTQIRLQDRQQPADVLAVGEPEPQIIDRESVTIMRNSA